MADDEPSPLDPRPQRCAERAALAERLADLGELRLAARLERCGQELPLTCTSCGARKVVLTRCDLKWCPSCAPLLAHRATERYAPICAEFIRPLFVTWTAKNWDDDAELGIRPMRRAFTKLRRLRWWKRCVRGGVAQLELTNIGNGSHPHIHSLIDSTWLSVAIPRPSHHSPKRYREIATKACEEVAEQWSLCLGRPATVFVRNVYTHDGGDPSAAVKEVIKYSVKPGALLKMPDPVRIIHELSLTRNLVSWGSAYRHPSLRKPPVGGCPCPDCAALNSFLPDFVIASIVRRPPR